MRDFLRVVIPMFTVSFLPRDRDMSEPVSPPQFCVARRFRRTSRRMQQTAGSLSASGFARNSTFIFHRQCVVIRVSHRPERLRDCTIHRSPSIFGGLIRKPATTRHFFFLSVPRPPTSEGLVGGVMAGNLVMCSMPHVRRFFRLFERRELRARRGCEISQSHFYRDVSQQHHIIQRILLGFDGITLE